MTTKKSPGRYWDIVWRCITGCSLIGACSPRCPAKCWLAGLLKRFPALHDRGYATGEYAPHPDLRPIWRTRPANEPVSHPELLGMPLKRKKPTVFMTHFGEFFDPAIDDDDDFRAECIGVMRKASQHTFLIPTKRWPECVDFVSWAIFPRNVYILFSAWDQDSTDAVKAYAPAAKHADPDLQWVLNLEPLIGPAVALGSVYEMSLADMPDAVIVGPENGPGRRPCKDEWIDAVRRECAYAGVPCFDKRTGEGSLPWRVK